MTERYRNFEPEDDDFLDIDPEFDKQVGELFSEPEARVYDLPEDELDVEVAGSWFSRIPLRKTLGTIAASAVLATGGLVASGKEATADTPPDTVAHHVYRTDGDGVWLHDGPGLRTPKEVVMPEGAEFDVQCFNPGGDLVNGNALWLTGSYNGRQGSTADYYVDTHWKTTQDLKDQGIPECGQEAQQESDDPNPQPAETIKPFVSYDRSAAANWALAHATDTPPNAGSCTWFVSQALAVGGFPQDNRWNINHRRLTTSGEQYGSDDAWLTPDFLAYMRTLPYVKVEEARQLKTGINNLPDARPGDIIIYDWTNDGYPDHADIVTGSAANNPEYPLVSGWSEDGSKALPYNQRGWTWSKKENQYLQLEKNSQGEYINWNMSAILIHINSEDESGIS